MQKHFKSVLESGEVLAVGLEDVSELVGREANEEVVMPGNLVQPIQTSAGREMFKFSGDFYDDFTPALISRKAGSVMT